MESKVETFFNIWSKDIVSVSFVPQSLPSRRIERCIIANFTAVAEDRRRFLNGVMLNCNLLKVRARLSADAFQQEHEFKHQKNVPLKQSTALKSLSHCVAAQSRQHVILLCIVVCVVGSASAFHFSAHCVPTVPALSHFHISIHCSLKIAVTSHVLLCDVRLG